MDQPQPINWSHGLNLSHQELYGIGCLVACFAHAENVLMWTARGKYEKRNGNGSRPNKWPWAFSKWIDLLDRLAASTLAGMPDHIAVSKFLVERGRELAKLRNKSVHWLAHTGGAGPATLTEPWGTKSASDHPLALEELHFNAEVLETLAVDVNRWRADLFELSNNMYSATAYQDGPPKAWSHGSLPLFSRATLDYNWPAPPAIWFPPVT